MQRPSREGRGGVGGRHPRPRRELREAPERHAQPRSPYTPRTRVGARGTSERHRGHTGQIRTQIHIGQIGVAGGWHPRARARAAPRARAAAGRTHAPPANVKPQRFRSFPNFGVGGWGEGEGAGGAGVEGCAGPGAEGNFVDALYVRRVSRMRERERERESVCV